MTTILELETERLVIKQLSEDDFDKVYRLQSHPEVMRFIGSGQPKSKDQVKQLFDMMLNHQKKHGFSLCPTYEKESGLLIGFSGLVHLALDDTNPDIEVGYWFLPKDKKESPSLEIASNTAGRGGLNKMRSRTSFN